jgi:hypothetical protein
MIESDSHLIGIENKIYHCPNNPFEDYTSFLDRKGEGRTVLKYLLTLRPFPCSPRAGFVPMLYIDFFREVRTRLGGQVSKADERYLHFLEDFMTTMDRLQSGLSPDQIAFFRERESELATLYTQVKQFKQTLRSVLWELKSQIEVSRYNNVKPGALYREPDELTDVLYHDVTTSGLVIAVDAELSARGWVVRTFLRDRSDIQKLEDFFKRLGIPYERAGDDLVHDKLSFDSPLSDVAGRLQQFLARLASA